MTSEQVGKMVMETQDQILALLPDRFSGKGLESAQMMTRFICLAIKGNVVSGVALEEMAEEMQALTAAGKEAGDA